MDTRPSTVAILLKCRNTLFIRGREDLLVANDTGKQLPGSQAISSLYLTEKTSRKNKSNVTNIPTTTLFNWHINTHPNLYSIYGMPRNRSNGNAFYRLSNPFNYQYSQRLFFVCTCVWPQTGYTRRKIVTICQEKQKRRVVMSISL